MVKIDDKGLTLLEVLITLAILGIATVSFYSLFTSTNKNINFSGKKVETVREIKSILDEIHSKAKYSKNENIKDFEDITREVLHHKGYDVEDYEIFHDKNDFKNYKGKKIHCLITEEVISIESFENSNDITSNIHSIKIMIFYDNGNKNIQISTYIPIKEDENG